MTELTMRRPDDWHLHLRQGDLLKRVLPFSERDFARALIMPNIKPPVVTVADLERYRHEITAAAQRTAFEPLMTIKITPWTTPATVHAARHAGAVAGKLYPEGVTTGADVGGVRNFDALWPVFDAMQASEMVLCLHGELPTSSVSQREVDFLPVLTKIARSFPSLRIVLEHVSTAAAVDASSALDNVAASITAHHLLITIDDVLSDAGMRPHLFCKPVAKLAADRAALLKAATSGDPTFFFGSDSAPHPRSEKESGCAPAGVFSAPISLPLLAQLFDSVGALSRLEAFTAYHGANFYGLPINTETVSLRKSEWTVADEYSGVVPLCAGDRLMWQVIHQGRAS